MGQALPGPPLDPPLAYSEDMRWRMVWQVKGLGCTRIQVAKNVGVDRSTVSRTIQLFRVTGSVSKRLYPKEQAFRKLTAHARGLRYYTCSRHSLTSLVRSFCP